MNSSTIVPRVRNNREVVFNLKPIQTRIQRAVKSFKPKSGAYNVDGNGKLSTKIRLTHDTNEISPTSVEVTILVDIVEPKDAPDGGPPPHPPKLTFQPPLK